ncbi:hypothetical protein D9R06_03485 [Kocuria marina subsp. indica]|nr:hypothetical protein D9R06_03485 [Kocuria indica]
MTAPRPRESLPRGRRRSPRPPRRTPPPHPRRRRRAGPRAGPTAHCPMTGVRRNPRCWPRARRSRRTTNPPRWSIRPAMFPSP